MRRFGVLITALYLVLNVLKLVSGCELPVNLNRPRYHAGLAESGGQIYYSGGVSSALTRLALSSVEVYDPQTNAIVNTFELPVARTKIFSTTAGSTVLFVGGTELFGNQQRSYNKVDIYDTNTRLLWTIDVPDLIVPDANVEVAGTKLFLTSRLNLDMVIIDISTNTTTKLPRPQNVQFIPIATASNGTHIFFLQNAVTNSMYIFEVATEQWIPFNVNIQIQTLSTIKMAMLGPRILVIIEPGRLTRIDMTFRVPRIRVLTFSNARMSQTVVGDRLYILTRHSIIVYTANGDLVEYTLGNTFTNDPTYSVVHNNIVYVSATSSSTASGSRFDLNMLFQPVPVNWRVQSYSEPLFAQRGYVAYLADRKMSHVNLKTQQSGASEEHPDIVHHIYTKTVAVGNKWMITLEKVYCLFDFDTETWSIYPMPYQLTYHSPLVSGRYVLFSHALYDEVPLYDIELNQWSMIQLNSISNRKHIIGDRVVTMASLEGIGIYHIPSQQWTVALNDSYIFDEASTTLGSKLIFAARPTNNLAQRLVCILDIYTLENTCVDAPAAFFLTEGIRTVRNYVVFNNQRTVNRYTIHSFYALNVDTLEWRTFDLPAILQSYRQMEVSVHQDVVYVLRLGRIDAIDMSRMKQFAINAPVTQPISISAYGSKVVFLTGTAGESQTAVIYETSVRTWTTIDFNGRFTSERFLVTQNYIASFIHQGLNSMEFPTMMNTITDEERFIGQSIQFTVNAVGRGLTTAWTFADGRSPISRQPSLLLSNLTEQNSGDYVVSITDTCQNVMRQTVNLQVHGAPSFAEQLTNSIMLCDQVTQFRVDVNGKLTQVDWELDNRLLEVTNRAAVNVSMDKFALTCNSEHNFCAIASNPAGEARSCARVQLRSLNAIFDGPRPSSTHPTYFTDSEVDLVVDLLHEDCTEHVWLLNGREIGEQQSRSSALSIRISQLVTANEYKVRAFCGNSELESSVFTFDPDRVSSLTPGGVAGIVIGAFTLLVGAIVTGVLVQRRLKRSRQHEIELENLLNEAKSESYKPKDGVSIIHTTTWEWSPSDGYTYRPIDNFPCDIDTSLLKYSLKHAVDIDVWIQGDIVFSPKEKSSAKGKQEKLLNGLQIDMYVPQSPKYEIKVEPANFTLQSDKQVRVTVSSKMRMTAKSNICLIVVCEQQMIYSVLEFKIESKPSMWIDIEEIKMTGDFLGGGGFGAVTRGVYRGQDVAVKKLLLQHMLDDVLHEFEHEITLMKSLHHPNIVQFVGASNVHENLAIIIEYAPLGSLSSVMKKQKLSFSMKVTALFETAKALQFLHANGIIHRDIKPQNILVFSLEQRTPVHVKLTDFGTARFISDNATNVTKNVGTFCYMAPESLGKNPRIDKSADVYSFAILMWEVLYELIPFEEFQWQSDLEKHVLEGKRLLLDPLPNDQLVRLIEECWHPDPSQRPSMTAVAQRLADL